MSRNHILHETRQWIDGILNERNWIAIQLARQCNVTPSSLLRFMRDGGPMPPKDVMMKIADVSGKPIPQSIMERL